MSFSWVPATHTNTPAHVLMPGSSLLGKNVAFSLSSIITMLSDSLHSSSVTSAASHSGQSRRTYTHSVIHSTGPALLSGPKEEQPRRSPKRSSAHTPSTHRCTFSLSITRCIHDGLRAQLDLKAGSESFLNSSPCSPERGGQYW